MDDDISSVCGISENAETMCCSSASLGDHDRVDELGISLSGQLKINNENRVEAMNGASRFLVERYYIAEDEEDEDEDEDEGGISEEALLAQMGYAESDSIRDYEEEEEEEEDEEEDLSEESILVKNKAPKHEPIHVPTAELNLVSALKGSREKEGRAIEECRVSWAPDVYDPPCTSDDHFLVSKNERHRVEHKVRAGSGKNRQKRGGVEGRVGGSKGSNAKAAGGSKDKKKAEKKHRKHKYSDPG